MDWRNGLRKREELGRSRGSSRSHGYIDGRTGSHVGSARSGLAAGYICRYFSHRLHRALSHLFLDLFLGPCIIWPP